MPRVSTVAKGQDPETQLLALRAYAARRGLVPVGEYIDKSSVKSPEKAPISPRLHWNSAALYAVATLARFTEFYGGLHQHSAYGLAFYGRI